MRELWRLRDARLYLIGQLLSVFGDSTLWLAVAIWVKQLTGSSSKAGLAFFAFTAGGLTAPVAGWVADRVPRRRLLLWTNSAIGGVVLLLLVADKDTLWLIYLVMFAYGVSSSLIAAAQTALLPHLVPDRLLPAANSTLTTGRESLRVVTPLLAAGAVAWAGTAKPIAVVDAASFAAVVVTLCLIRPSEPRGLRAPQRWRFELVEGLRHLARTTPLRQMVTALGVALFVFGFSETLVFSVVDHGLHRSPTFVGVLSVFQGAGSIVGGICAPTLIRRWGEGRAVAVALAVLGLGQFLWMPSSLISVLVGAALFGAALPTAVVGYVTMIQRLTPDELRGRAFAAADAAISLPQTMSIALGAALLLVLDYRWLLAVEAVVVTSAGVWLVTRKAQRGASTGPANVTVGAEAPIATLSEPPEPRSMPALDSSQDGP